VHYPLCLVVLLAFTFNFWNNFYLLRQVFLHELIYFRFYSKGGDRYLTCSSVDTESRYGGMQAVLTDCLGTIYFDEHDLSNRKLLIKHENNLLVSFKILGQDQNSTKLLWSSFTIQNIS